MDLELPGKDGRKGAIERWNSLLSHGNRDIIKFLGRKTKLSMSGAWNAI
jgi:hypothetical protein